MPVWIPEWDGTLVHWLMAIFAVCAPVFFLTEAHGGLAFGYSKFANREARFTLPSKVGMFVLYFPAVFLFPVALWVSGAETTTWHWLLAAMVSIHFAKRCVEALFVHKYSGVMNGFSVVMICSLYSLVAGMLGWIAATEVTPAMLESGTFAPLLIPGVALWAVGTAMNAWHHLLLANLRKPGETGYVVPRGGLFAWVCCPHYLCELIAWYGVALAFHHVGAWVISVTMTAYLAGRAHSTLRWYRSKDLELPDGWKRLVPFVY